MGLEIEHKYLVTDDSYKAMSASRKEIAQGYLSRETLKTVRVRVADDRGYLTVKGITTGDTRLEFEYPVPLSDAEEMLRLCEGRVVRKTRWYVYFAGHTWEVDEFHDDLAPLVIAEIELPDSTHDYEIPPFIGDEVTGDSRYYNSNL